MFCVAKLRFWLDWEFLVLRCLVMLHNVSLVTGVGTINAFDPTLSPRLSPQDFVADLSLVLAPF